MNEQQRYYQKQFKKHWRYASKLKEGGSAWEREMQICENCMKQLGLNAFPVEKFETQE